MMANETFLQGLDESKQKKAMAALENLDRDGFTTALLGKASPSVMDYLMPTGKFSQTWDLFHDLVGQKLSSIETQKRAMQQPLGPLLQAFPGAIQPEESQFRTRMEPLMSQTMQPPNVGTFSDAGPMNPAGRMLQGPPELIPTNAPPEASSSEQFAYRFPTQPIRELDPNATITAGQAPLVQQLLAGHLVSPGQALVPPSLQAERERTAIMADQAQSPMGKVLADFKRTPANSPAAGILLKQMEAQLDPEALQTFKGALDLAGIQPGTPQYKTAMTNFVEKQSTHQPAASQNLTIKQETAESQGVGSGFAKSYNAILDSGVTAGTKLAKLDRLSMLMDGVETGKLTPAITTLQALGQSFGITVDPALAPKQAIQALSSEIALELRNPSGGAGMPGAMSDKDREFLISMTPNLSITPGGNQLIIETAKKLAKRDQEVARLARDYRKKTGHMDEGFYDVLQAFSEKHPLFAGKTAMIGPPAIANDAEYQTLPSGTVFLDPNGKQRKKP